MKIINSIENNSFIFPTNYLPPCFKNNELINGLDDIFARYENIEEILKENFDTKKKTGKYVFKTTQNSIYDTTKGTEPIHFYISKPTVGIRTLSVANPLVLVPMHKYIIENREKLLSEQSESNKFFFASSHFYCENDGIKIWYDYDSVEYEISKISKGFYQNNMTNNLIKKIKISSGKFYCLSVDISHFYNNIYTHMISRNAVNMDCVKILENLDTFNRCLNFNETKGILIGPYTSSLFSELILSKIDREIIKFLEAKNYDIAYDRYCDDYSFFCDSKEQLENNLLPFIEQELSRYKFDINYSKCEIIEFPFTSDGFAIKEFTNDFIMKFENDSYDDMTKIELIINSINLLSKRKYYYVNYFLESILNLDFEKIGNDDEIEILIDYLFSNMLKNDLNSKRTINLIMKIFGIRDIDKKIIIEKWIARVSKITSHKNHTVVIWLLYLINYYKISSSYIEKFVLSCLRKNELSDILIFEYIYANDKAYEWKDIMLKYLNDIDKEISDQYNSTKAVGSYLTKYWLLFYTDNVRWHFNKYAYFRNTILEKTDFDYTSKLTNGKRLNLFYIMAEKKINLFSMEDM